MFVQAVREPGRESLTATLLNARALFVTPDLGALNSCMHTFPDKIQLFFGCQYYGLTHDSMCLDMGFETLNLISCEFGLRELTVSRKAHETPGSESERVQKQYSVVA